MKSYFSRLLHHSMSSSNLPRISRWKKFANLFDLDTPVKPECDTMWTDTPIKSECDTLEKSASTGRSMVEMLGVLAIIGVLSVGAIAGYSKAMMKYKLNKQAEQLSTVINAVATYGLQIKSNPVPVGSSSRISIIPALNKLNYIPKEMLKNNQNDYIYDVFNSQIELGSGYYNKPGWLSSKYYSSVLIFLDNGKSSHDVKICQNVLNTVRESRDSIWYIELISAHGLNTSNIFAVYYGDKYCTDERVCLKDLTVTASSEFCTSLSGQNIGTDERFAINMLWK